jgi:ATP-dependent Lhr-like helicase
VSDNPAFELLSTGVRKAIYDKGWESLHPIQIESIRTVYQSEDHLLISAQTAGGKTEAAFLPIISKIDEKAAPSVQALYVGPLKALINDQFMRMGDLCSNLSIPVHRWHGDVGATEKHSVIRQPGGILLITPESLEAIFLRRGRSVPPLFCALEYVVIDELHSFLDNVRGIHLQSLLARMRSQAGCNPRMGGLSATLGDYAAAKRFLDIDHPDRVRLIENPSTTTHIRLGLKSFVRPFTTQDSKGQEKSFAIPVERISEGLSRLTPAHFQSDTPLQHFFTPQEKESFGLPRPDDIDLLANEVSAKFSTSTNLIFCNSKSTLELLADRLRQLLGKTGSTDNFVVHHASLSRSQRDDAEERLKGGIPTTAICSSTLEMGIDIADVKAVGQIQAPWTVSSMVQRLGRSGRRPGEASIFRPYTRDFTPHPDSSLTDLLCPDLTQTVAIIELMLEKWLESPDTGDLNLSTLVHQILSYLTQTGGMTAQLLFDSLVKSGPFRGVTPELFQRVLKALMQRLLVGSLPPNLLIVGTQGEFLTASRDFYAAFMSQEEFMVEYQDEAIGKIPPDKIPPKGENLLLGGRRWVVLDVVQAELTVLVAPSKDLKPPYFTSSGLGCGNRIAEKMRIVLQQDSIPSYLDVTATILLKEARRIAGLSGAVAGAGLVVEKNGVRFFPWAGVKIHATLCALAKTQGIRTAMDRLSIAYREVTFNQVAEHFRFITESSHDSVALASLIAGKAVQKFDQFLDDDILNLTNSTRLLDVTGTVHLILELRRSGLLFDRKSTV